MRPDPCGHALDRVGSEAGGASRARVLGAAAPASAGAQWRPYTLRMENEYSIDIERPQDVVFEWLDDPDNLQLMVPNLVEHGIINETPQKVGTTFWQVFEEHGRKMKMTGVVTEYKPPDRMAVEIDGSMFGLDVSYRFEALAPNRTRVTQYSKARFKHVFKLMGLLLAKKMKAEGEKAQAENFARMKAILEGDAD
jgi:carbon monoxide dehydrogenase subunit G